MKGKAIIVLTILFLVPFVLAHGEESLGEGKELVESQVSCSELTESQLAAIGDYYMEQIHPGEAHEVMDEMMGGEGSETLEQAHIRMAQSLYCGEGNMVSMMGRGTPSGTRTMMQGYEGDSQMGIYVVVLAVLAGIILWITTQSKSKKKRR